MNFRFIGKQKLKPLQMYISILKQNLTTRNNKNTFIHLPTLLLIDLGKLRKKKNKTSLKKDYAPGQIFMLSWLKLCLSLTQISNVFMLMLNCCKQDCQNENFLKVCI